MNTLQTKLAQINDEIAPLAAELEAIEARQTALSLDKEAIGHALLYKASAADVTRPCEDLAKLNVDQLTVKRRRLEEAVIALVQQSMPIKSQLEHLKGKKTDLLNQIAHMQHSEAIANADKTLIQAENRLANSEINLQKASNEVQRLESKMTDNATSKQDAQAAYDSAQTALGLALERKQDPVQHREAMRKAQNDLDDATALDRALGGKLLAAQEAALTARTENDQAVESHAKALALDVLRHDLAIQQSIASLVSQFKGDDMRVKEMLYSLATVRRVATA